MPKNTVKAVAEKAGVSIATVSRVINNMGNVSSDTVEKVNAAIKELGYMPNFQARSLKTNKTNTIGVVIPELAVPFFSSIANSLEVALRKKGYFMLVSCHHDRADFEKSCLMTLEGMRVDALVISSTGYNENYLHKLNSAGIVTLLLDRKPISYHLPSVSSDKASGFYRLTEHLYKLGHRRFAFATSDPKISSNRERYEGVKKFFDDNTLPMENLTCYYKSLSEESGFMVAEDIFSKPASVRPTALIAGSSSIASGALRYCKNHNVPVPSGLSVVSIGDFDVRDLMINTLTHMDELHEELGQKLAEVLLELLNGSFKGSFPIVLPTDIIIGTSTGVPN